MRNLISILAITGLSILVGSSALAIDYKANYCEIFVDRVASTNGSHGTQNITLYLKTANNRLDDRITRVVFYSRILRNDEATFLCSRSGYRNYECDDLDRWQARAASPFPKAKDYWVINLALAHDYTFPHVYEGAFYVETVKGTRYWVNPMEGGNFFIDLNLKNNVDRARGGRAYNGDLDNSISTSEKFQYLNPSGCR